MRRKHIYEYRGNYIYQYGRWLDWYILEVNNEATRIKLINKNTSEEIKGIKNILRYVKLNNLEIREA